MLKLKS